MPPAVNTIMKYVKLFEDAPGLDRFVLGGKGYGLVEMTSIGLQVPPGFVITTDACKQYYANGERVPAGLFEQVREGIAKIEEKLGKRLGETKRPLLLSVRSGAPYSMPGMMDTILNIGINDSVAESLAVESRNQRFALDAYRRLIQMFSKTAMGVRAEELDRVLASHKIDARSWQDTRIPITEVRRAVEELKKVVKSTTGSEFPQDPWVQLRMAIDAVFKSWNSPRAKEYRKYYKISEEIGTAVNVQAMVFGNMGENSGSGVGFTRNPSTGQKELYGEYLANSQGEDVVAGVRTPTSLESLQPQLRGALKETASTLEKHFRDMQDFEFTVENGILFILQTRSGKRTASAAVKMAVDMVGEGLISKTEAISRLNPDEFGQLLHRAIDPRAKVKPIARGLGASPGAASGYVVFRIEEAARLREEGKNVILVREETRPEDIKGLIASQGVLTAKGGMTSHAAVVARGMGKPAVVGCSGITIYPGKEIFETPEGVVVKEGQTITIDGTTGSVILGVVATIEPELTQEIRTLLEWTDQFRRLGVWANADTPEAARKARDFGADGIGLCRTERMFNAPDRLPIVIEMIMSGNEKERRDSLERLIPFQLSDFKQIFREMVGKPVIVRLLDLPLHEFLPTAGRLQEEIVEMQRQGAAEEVARREEVLLRVRQLEEHNPMLGHRGGRLGITYPEIYEAQTKAILQAAIEILKKEGRTAKINIMLPLISEAREMEILRDIVDSTAELVFKKAGASVEYKVGTMIETPRAALTASEIAKYADFFSFGTNDLTQTTFAYSRDDAEAKFMARYLEKRILEESPFEVIDRSGVGRLITICVAEGKRSKPSLEVGVCGEHGGDPRSITFFQEAGLDYVSCSVYRLPVAKLAAAQAALTMNVRAPTTV